VTGKLSYTGIDLEGIAFDAADSTLWITDEATKEVVHLTLSGSVVSRSVLTYASENNKGPEGITIGPDHRLYVLNERTPSVLMRLDAQQRIERVTTLNFASDYSDVAYDAPSDLFFILSDESMAFYLWKSSGTVIEKFNLPEIKNEGIAFDRKGQRVILVNDQTGMFTVYSIISEALTIK
jgi:uncharacterized protein YjiK